MDNVAATVREERRLGDLAPRWSAVAGLTGLAGLAVGVVFGFVDGWEVFFRSYILNFAFVLSLALGALFFVLLQHVTRAGWSVVLRRQAEALAATIPILALAFLPVLVPVLAGLGGVYPWASAAEVQHDPLLAWKRPYLNAPFFIARCVLYFAVWGYLAVFYFRHSVAQDAGGDVALTLRMQKLSGAGLLAYALTVTFFAFDVLMSLTPHWYSTIYGVYYFSGAVVGFFALLALTAVLLQRAGRLTRSLTVEHYHDVGKLAFGFVVFWAYIAFSQYMLIWYANLPEETSWYYVRQSSAWWRGVSLVLLFGHFVVPFLMLLARYPKRQKGLLALAAGWILAVHWIDVYYLVIPQAHHLHAGPAAHAGVLHVSDLALLAGLGGLLAWAVVRNLAGRALLPERDPRLEESLAFENI